jgi:AraC-like DNA-binding protein
MEYTNSQIREIIAEHLHNERDRRIMEKRLIDGLTVERLSEEFDLSVSQMKRIIWRDSEIIFRHVPP